MGEFRADSGLKAEWYPLYTRSRSEKAAYAELKKRGYEAFLPLKKSLRRWSDRKKLVELPLIPSYVFVKAPRSDLREIVRLRNVSRYISFNGKPASAREREIEMLKLALENELEIEVLDGKLEKGSIVKFASGLFAGYTGKVVGFRGKKKLAIELDCLGKTVIVSLDNLRANVAADA